MLAVKKRWFGKQTSPRRSKKTRTTRLETLQRRQLLAADLATPSATATTAAEVRIAQADAEQTVTFQSFQTIDVFAGQESVSPVEAPQSISQTSDEISPDDTGDGYSSLSEDAAEPSLGVINYTPDNFSAPQTLRLATTQAEGEWTTTTWTSTSTSTTTYPTSTGATTTYPTSTSATTTSTTSYPTSTSATTTSTTTYPTSTTSYPTSTTTYPTSTTTYPTSTTSTPTSSVELSIGDFKDWEGKWFSFPVFLSEPVSEDVHFSFSTSDGSAKHNRQDAPPDERDYRRRYKASGKIPAGYTTATALVRTLADGIPENMETFYVNISLEEPRAKNVKLGRSEAYGDIIDMETFSGVLDVGDGAAGGCSVCVAGSGVGTDARTGSATFTTPDGAIRHTTGGNQSVKRTVGLKMRSGQAFDGSFTDFDVSVSADGQQIGSAVFTKPAGDEHEFYGSLPIDISSLPAGQTNATISVGYTDQLGANQTFTQTLPLHVDRSLPSLSGGWSYNGVERLHLPEPGIDRAVLNEGNGFSTNLLGQAGGVYTSATEPGTSLRQDQGSGEWELKRRDGSTLRFDVDGMLKEKTDSNGNRITYSYTDANIDGVTEELDTITLPTGVVLDYDYDASGMLSSYTDEHGNVWNYAFQNGQLKSVTGVDPDGAGPQSAQQFSYDYNADGQVSAINMPGGFSTQLAYSAAGVVDEVQRADGSVESIQAQATLGFAGGVGATAGVALTDAVARLTDGGGSQRKIRFDENGKVVEVWNADDVRKSIQRGPDGLPREVASVGGDGSDATAEMDYDSRGNLIRQVDADGAIHQWDYHATWNVPTRYIDPLGRETLMEIDPATGDVLRIAHQISSVAIDPSRGGQSSSQLQNRLDRFDVNDDGIVDLNDHQALLDYLGGDLSAAYPDIDGSGGATSSDALSLINFLGQDFGVESFTYSQAGGSLPAGLLLSHSDPLGVVTQYAYVDTVGSRAFGKLKSVTVAVGTASQATVTYEYDGAGRMSAEIDPLGARTEYVYDNAGRLITTRTPDPDGASGPLVAAESHYQYDDAGRVSGVVDPLGRVTNFEFDEIGRITKVLAPELGNGSRAVTQREYDDAGRLAAEIDPLGRRTEYEYDDVGRLIQLRSPNPNNPSVADVATDFFFNDAGLLVSQTGPSGATTDFQYDVVGRLLRQMEAAPEVGQPRPETQFSYDAAGRMISLIDPMGSETQSLLDDLDRLAVSILPAVGGVSARQVNGFDAAGRQTGIADELGNWTFSEFDSVGQLVKVTQPDPDGFGPQAAPVWWYEYDLAGQLTRSEDPTGVWQSTQYDALGRPTEQYGPDSAGSSSLLATWTYDAAGQQTESYSAVSGRVWNQFDAMGRLISSARSLADQPNTPETATQLKYDLAGRVTEQIDPLGNRTAWTYDGLDRPTEMAAMMTAGAPLATTWTYDLAGNRLSETDGAGNQSNFTYDALGRVLTATNPDGDTTSYQYNAAGQLSQLTDQSGNVTAWQFDELGRITAEIDPQGEQRHYVYDAASRLISESNRDGRSLEYGYDALGRTITERWLSVGNQIDNTLSFTYDAAGRLLSAVDPLSATVQRSYDMAGNLATESADVVGYASTTSIVSGYHASGLRSQRQFHVDGVANVTDTWSFDALGRVSEVARYHGGSAAGIANLSVDLAYDAAGRLASIERFQKDAGDVEQAIAQTAYSFDEVNRLTQIAHGDGNSSINTLGLSYVTGTDRLAGLTQSAGLDLQYGYTPGGQVDSVTSTDPELSTSITYGADGNRISTDGQAWTTDSGNELTDDGQFTYSYDADGRRTSRVDKTTGETTSYVWDHRGRLVEQTTTLGGTVTGAVRYGYDALDRRVVIERSEDGQNWDKDRHVYDGDHLLAVMDETGEVNERFLHGPMVDQVLAEEQIDPGTGETEVFWPLNDHLGSARDVVQWDEVLSETVTTGHIEYDAFGREIERTGSADELHFGYTGRDRDSGTDLQYNRARYYDSETGRWISQDPIGFAAGDANLYRYVGNAPTTKMDPSGLAETDDRPRSPGNSRLQDADQELSAIINGHLNDARADAKKLGLKGVAAGKYITRHVYLSLGANRDGTGYYNPFGVEIARTTHMEYYLERVLGSTGKMNDIPFTKSIFRNTPTGPYDGCFPAYKAPVIAGAVDHTIAPTISVSGVLMGTDKWGHFMQQGYWLYKLHRDGALSRTEINTFSRWLEGDPRLRLTPQQNKKYLVLSKMISGGEVNRFGYYGTYSTGIASRGDVDANRLGFHFYRAIEKNPWGFIFRAKPHPQMNEGLNPSHVLSGVEIDEP